MHLASCILLKMLANIPLSKYRRRGRKERIGLHKPAAPEQMQRDWCNRWCSEMCVFSMRSRERYYWTWQFRHCAMACWRFFPFFFLRLKNVEDCSAFERTPISMYYDIDSYNMPHYPIHREVMNRHIFLPSILSRCYKRFVFPRNFLSLLRNCVSKTRCVREEKMQVYFCLFVSHCDNE